MTGRRVGHKLSYMKPLRRLRAFEDPDPIYGPMSRYSHPNGWRIRKEVRDWDARPYRGSAGNPDGKVSWIVYPSGSSAKKWVEAFRTLRAAREWCDEHDRYASA